jgi:tetratricopeptide (TPR) repeat protein
MYLKGSRWSYSQRRKRGSPFRIIALLGLVAGALYINQVVVPATPPLFIPTATPTRSPESFINDAQVMISSGKINQAIETYKQAVKADPRNPAVYVTLARWQVLYGDYDGAMENVQNALLINQTHALAKAVRGWILGKQGQYLEAEAELKDALDLDPKSALAHAYLAEVYKDKIDAGKEDLNTRDLASQISRTAVALDSSIMEVRRARGLVLEVTGNYEEAVTEFESAVTMNPNLADLHVALGRNYTAVQAYDRAVEEFNTAISLKPDDPEPYYQLARAYLTVGEFAKGVQIAEQAVEKDPSDPYLQSLLGTLYFKSGDYKTSIAPLRLAAKGGMTDDGVAVTGLPLDNSLSAINLYSRYGLALANTGECGEALIVSQLIFKVVPDDENATYNAQVMIDTCKEQVDGTPETTPEAEITETPAP